MPRYTFSGVAYPERALIELQQPLTFDMENKEVGVTGRIELAIYKSQIIINFDTPAEISDIYTTRNLIKDAVQTVLDIAGMQMAVAYNADIRTVSGPNSHLEVFGPSIPNIGIKNDETRSIDILAHFIIAGSDPFVRRALADVRSAISYPVDTGFFCYRAIESLINARLNAIGKKLDGIASLEADLRLDSSCIEMLRRLGGGARHGKIVTITGQDRSLAISIVREIINRYVEVAQGKRVEWDMLKA